ncbi:hypothetical protein KAJ27_13405 [bacterium]|nr:hypothetical protein [Candidatus Neomarinimicrobiota bacterium]MCK5685120.1 hypothetical protein [bacterium]
MGNVGHGNPYGIQLENGFLDYNWFASQDLNDEIFYFNSCQVFNDPLRSSILNGGNARTFIGGIVNLPVGASEEVFKDFFDYTLNDGWEMDESLVQGEINNNLIGYHDIGGDAGVMNLTVSGTLRGNEIWSGNIGIVDDVIVPAGVRLTINSGTTITTANGEGIEINGKIIVNGTLANPVVFNSESGIWTGLKLVNADNTSSINYCDIQNADIGIYLYNSSPTLTNNVITNSMTNAIYMSGSSPILLNNIISNNDGNAIVAVNSSPEFGTGDVFYNGNNTIAYNLGIGIYASSSTVNMGTCTECHSGGGMNSIYNNSTDCYTCHGGGNDSHNIWAESNSNVIAEGNWWGTNPPSFATFISLNGSSIDYTPWLTSDPNPGSLLFKVSSTSEEAISTFDHSQLSDLDRARYYKYAKNYAKVMAI